MTPRMTNPNNILDLESVYSHFQIHEDKIHAVFGTRQLLPFPKYFFDVTNRVPMQDPYDCRRENH